ncbi:DNA/RNA nuclease SfsA [Myxococcota bacterium]|nr:DNA/RNA nuclease SfsA [Myxococcota bacterium]MBU1495732.1 DNA/RNA nuclease SfsA [Myxococcota bacterium]
MNNYLLKWPLPVEIMTFIRRKNRFISEMLDSTGLKVEVHSPNTGSMKNLLLPGSRCLVHNTGKVDRKYPFSWISVENEGVWVGIDTIFTNKIAGKLIRDGFIPDLTDILSITPEVKTGQSRLDFKVVTRSGFNVWIEVKNVTLLENKTALFPDAVTERGIKHLEELMTLKVPDHRCIMLYIINRGDAEFFDAAREIHKAYESQLKSAIKKGVEIFPVVMHCDTTGVKFLKFAEISENLLSP